MDSWNSDYMVRWNNEDNKKSVPSIDAEVIRVCVSVTVSACVPVCVTGVQRWMGVTVCASVQCTCVCYC